MKHVRVIFCVGFACLCLVANGCWAERAKTELQEGLKSSNEGDYQNAILSFTNVIRLEPGMAEAHYYRGLARYQVGLYEEAIADYSRAILIQPVFPEAFLNRGLARHRLGDYQAAIEDMEQAIELNPRDGNAYLSRDKVEADSREVIIGPEPKLN
ncbi:MAG: tetratricopeptide repeat protein [Planctomycetaceae bacterium]|nr:tetratricopeptide repeat protein [Planctomycetaceae bacterium]MCP4478670.1 tetratricopeptide repeat protein [Planctomycetaceae bacterium]MCP4773718.1 tetratricopeptide repeat protein [Planctomycetaceae bacterium]